jgi:predicted Zn-dependent protease with MMP-like domain
MSDTISARPVPLGSASLAERWTTAVAPSLETFEIIARDAFARLPKTFRDMAGDVVIRIDELPEDAVLDQLGIDSPFDLLGLYHGVSLADRSISNPVPASPSVVSLYRRSLLDHWVEFEDTLGELITHVLVHEIGHHFGLSDDDMTAIEEAASENAG